MAESALRQDTVLGDHKDLVEECRHMPGLSGSLRSPSRTWPPDETS
jgi:hypothetical protein